MALWSAHKIDFRMPLTKEGLAYETFCLVDGTREAIFYVHSLTFQYVQPTKEMRKRMRFCTSLLHQYRFASTLAARQPNTASRFLVMALFYKIMAVLDGMPEPQSTPYDLGN